MVRTLIALVSLVMLAVSPVTASKGRWEEMVEMAGHLRWSGQFAEAEKLLKKALKEAESSGLDDRDLSITLSGLASVYLDQCKYADAEAAQRRAKEIDERLSPQDPEVLADDLATLAIAYLYLGRSEESKQALKRALELRPAHVADTLVVQARFYMMAGRYAESEYLFKQAQELLEIREGHRGPDDPGMAGSLADFAILYEMQGKTAQSDPLFERAFRLDAPATTERLIVWAEGALKRKQYGQADHLLARAIPPLEKRPQPEDLVLVTALEERAEALRKSGRKAEAVAPASRAEAIRKKLGPCGLVGMREVALGDIQAAEAAGRIESWKRRSYEEMDHNRDGKICVDEEWKMSKDND